MSKGRQIGRVKFLPPSPETAKKYLRYWRSKDLYYSPEAFPKINSRSFFGIEQSLHLEIGCGTGEYICALAERNKDEYFIGIDYSRRAIYYAVETARRKALENIIFIQADFKRTYHLLEEESLKKVYLHFPDPNYGKKHIKDRVFEPHFLDHMHLALTASGQLSVVTDQEDLFMDMLAIAEADPRFEKKHAERYLTTFDPIEKSEVRHLSNPTGKVAQPPGSDKSNCLVRAYRQKDSEENSLRLVKPPILSFLKVWEGS